MKSNRTLLLLLMICMSPVIFSWMSFYFYDYFHLRRSNHGILLEPPQKIDFIPADDHTWQIMFAPANCSEAAEKILINLENVRKILGENQNRVSLDLLPPRRCDWQKHSFREIALTDEQMKHYAIQTGRIYLADPLHNVFIYYPAEANLLDVYRDVKRVLDASQIG